MSIDVFMQLTVDSDCGVNINSHKFSPFHFCQAHPESVSVNLANESWRFRQVLAQE